MTRDTATAYLRQLAASVREPDHAAAVARLMERVATAPPEVQAALLEIGAEAVLLAPLIPQERSGPLGSGVPGLELPGLRVGYR